MHLPGRTSALQPERINMADIIVNDIHKRFDQDREILSGVSFHIDAGERVALLGDNGAGKTTMMRILTG